MGPIREWVTAALGDSAILPPTCLLRCFVAEPPGHSEVESPLATRSYSRGDSTLCPVSTVA